MRNLGFQLGRAYATLAIKFYFNKVEVIGKENVPKNKPVLFIANHRNGMIDPILIASHLPFVFHFLTRASAFKNPIANFLLRSINMLPIYRIRDGVESLQKNQEIFEKCYDIFNQNETVLIFAEGNHGYPRRVRPLSKGFTRIAFGFLEKYKDQELYIIPIGLNYENLVKPFKKAAIYIGEPILTRQYYNVANENLGIDNLKNDVFNALTQLTTHIESSEKHDLIVKKMKQEGFDFTNPLTANQRVKELNLLDLNDLETQNTPKKKKSIFYTFITLLFSINTILPILFWQWVKPKVKDIVMLSTFRLGVSVALIPLNYLIFSIIFSYFFGLKIGLIYLFVSFFIVYLRKKIS